MPDIHAPYNFVPVLNRTYTPGWISSISQDIPFSDGESGTIKLRIDTHSPIYVRNGTTKQQLDARMDEWKSFSSSNGKFFIPGTSIKGAIRNVLEILSFGKMFCPPVDSSTACRRVNDHRHSFRDLSPAGKDAYLDKMKPQSIRAGWLRKLPDGSLVIADWGIPARISHRDIDAYLGTNFVSFFSNPRNMGNSSTVKMAKYKYEKIPDLNRLCSNFTFKKLNTFEAASVSPSGNPGIIVLTGQPSPRFEEKKQGKKWEFVFREPENESILEVTRKDWLDFLSIYNDSDSAKVAVDWRYWREKMDNGQDVPVFFRVNEKTQALEHFGLAYLYKMPSEKSVRDGLSSYHQSETSCDLADCVFGFVADDKEMIRKEHPERTTLRGRIQFSHAWATQGKRMEEKTEVLGSPKSSYYPSYLRQHGNNGRVNSYSTYMDKGGICVSGWKRYPIRSGSDVAHNNPIDNDRVTTCFVPLAPGASFEFCIRVHNCRSVEIGALLSAITFHDTDGCFHSFGMAKPLGYGKSSIKIVSSQGFAHDLSSKEGRKHYQQTFETEMNIHLFDGELKWHASEQVKELLAMANGQLLKNPNALAYMSLDEHVEAKQRDRMNYLQKFSEISGSEKEIVQPLSSLDMLRDATEQKKLEQAARKLREVEIEKKLQAEKEVIEAKVKEEKHRIFLEEEKKQNEGNRKKYESGLSTITNETDIGKILSYVKNFMQGDRKLSVDEKSTLLDILRRSYAQTGNKDNKWKKESKSKEIWKEIRKCLGDEAAQSLKTELSNIQQ